jgi:hypothetical protein
VSLGCGDDTVHVVAGLDPQGRMCLAHAAQNLSVS